jgi:hypothetical protein
VREADRAEAEAWSIRMEGYGRPAQPSPTIAQCLNGGYGWLEVDAIAAKPAPAFRLMPSAAGATRRSCKKGRYAPPVQMIKLTREREIAP